MERVVEIMVAAENRRVREDEGEKEKEMGGGYMVDERGLVVPSSGKKGGGICLYSGKVLYSNLSQPLRTLIDFFLILYIY